MAVVNSFAKFFSANYPLESDVANTAPTYGDAINVLDGTLDPGAAGEMPSPADVRLGVAVAETTGTLAVPAPGEVLLNIATDATLGTYVTAAAGDVRDAVTFGAASAEVGLLDLPSINDVRLNVQFDQLSKTGNVREAVPANVLLGYAYGTQDTLTGTMPELIGTMPAAVDVRLGTAVSETVGSLAVPNPANVLLGVSTDDTTGVYRPVIEANVRDTIVFGASESLTGVLVSPAESDTRLAVAYGSAGEYVGTVREAVAANVLLNYAYGDADSVIGELDVSASANLPAIEEVLDGIVFGATNEFTGVWTPAPQAGVAIEVSFGANAGLQGQLTTPNQVDVRLNTLYGPNLSLTGSLDPGGSGDPPAAQDVREGVIYSEGAATGRLVVPDPADVRLATLFDSPIPGVEKTGTLDLPDISDVRLSVEFDGATKVGDVAIPIESATLLGYRYDTLLSRTGTLDPGGTSQPPLAKDLRFGVIVQGVQGTLGLPMTSQVLLGVGYGAEFTEFVGTLTDLPGGSGSTNPPVRADGSIRSPLFVGDSYLAANGNAFVWDISPIEGMDGGALVATLTGFDSCGACTDPAWMALGTVEVIDADTWRVTVEMSTEVTAEITPGDYLWTTSIEDGTASITVAAGSVVWACS